MNQRQSIEPVLESTYPASQWPFGNATSQIQYVSRGHCLIIGDVVQALDAGSRYTGAGFTVVTIDPAQTTIKKQLTEEGVAVFTVPVLDLQGHLGAWQATVRRERQSPFDLAVSVYRESGYFDVVLDLSEKAFMPMAMPPFGYTHVTDAAGLDSALQALAGLSGEFEKPRYFHYTPTLCAHSRNELAGCDRCLSVCAPEAIQSDGEGIRVDPFRCQGCGSCATVCPSGAIHYAYPRPADALTRTRDQGKAQGATVLLLYTESQQTQIDTLSLGDEVLALMVEEVTAFGPDYWLTMLVAGIRYIGLVMDSPAEDPGRRAVESQLGWVGALLADIGVSEVPVSILYSDELVDRVQTFTAKCAGADALCALQARYFATHNDKRQTLRLALDALSEQLARAAECTVLPAGAPFGQVRVNSETCTLCMACASTCPAGALQDGQELPALQFIEANCVQCGLCEAACPESAISLQPRYRWNSIEARKAQTLLEEQPFRCLRCRTAFSTQRMIDSMTKKLSGHWMFQNGKAIERLQLCGDCRVKDMFEDDAAGIETHP